MSLVSFRAGPPSLVPRPIAAPAPRPTGNRASDWFERVERPARNDPREQEIASELRKRINEWQSADTEFQRNSELELDFLSGLQWIEEEGSRQDKAREMASKGRSAFTIDLLTPSVELVVNMVRINKLTATFIPVGGQADTATADVRQGLYRNIERVSKAAIARETAYQMAVSVGRGYERILIEDEEGATFSKKITIRRVDNLQSIAIDPTCLDFNYRDAAWAYTFDDLWKDEFLAEYGEGMDVDVAGLGLPDDASRNFWFPKDKVKVGEYFRRVWKKREVWRLEDGTVCWKEDAPEGARPARDGKPSVKTKMDSVLEWRKMTGVQTMEKRIWPGKIVPIVVFVGREVFRGKKPKIHSGLVRAAMAPCRIHNYMVSRTVDEVALSPLPHMFSAVGHLSPEQKTLVNEINSHPWSNIEYTPLQDEAGRALPPPGWASPSPNIAAVVQATAGAKDDLQRVLNTYAPQLGRPSSVESGRAMREVKDQGDVSHAAFYDNFKRSMFMEAEIVNELMDVVYTDAQAITITDPDERTRQVLINQEYYDKRKDKMVKHLFGVDAAYSPVLDIGASYPTRRAEAGTRLLELAKMFPQMGQALDLILADLDIPNYQKYQDRVRPPGFHADDEEGPNLSEIRQQRDQAVQTLNQAHQLINQLMQKVQELGSKEAMKRLEIASRERIAAAQDRTTVVAAEIKAKQLDAHAALLTELEVILKQLEMSQDTQQAANDQQQPEAAPQPTAPQTAPTGLTNGLAPQGGAPAPAPGPAPPAPQI